MKIFDFLYISIRNLQRRKLRSWLTTLGIIIGISLIVALISISVGMQKAIEESFEKMGENKLIVLPGGSSFSPTTAFMGKPFTEKEIEKIRSIGILEAVVPISYVTLSISYRDTTIPTIISGLKIEKNVKLTNAGYEILEGRDFYERDKDKCNVILGYQIAKVAFEKELKPGDKIKIGQVKCKVIGVLKATGSRLDDYTVYVPLNVLKKYFGVKEIRMIIVKSKDLDRAKELIKKVLLKTRNEKEFSILTPQQFAEQIKSILGLVSLIVTAIAGISMVISGIGIMNTMYMAVTERTREIGLLKAIGAKNHEILILFLLESGMLGLIGGIIGTFIGILGSKTIEYFANLYGYSLFKSYIDINLILLAVVFSFVVGIVSGFLPARAASKLDPVQALRYE